MEHVSLVFYKLRYMTYLLIVVAGFLLFSVLLSFIGATSTAPPKTADAAASAQTAGVFGSYNVVANSAYAASAKVKRTIVATEVGINRSAMSVALSIVHAGKFAVNSTVFIIRTMVHSIALMFQLTFHFIINNIVFIAKFTGRALGKSVAFVSHIPAAFLGITARAANVSALIRPADHTPAPVLDSRLVSTVAKSAAAHPALPTAQTVSQPAAQPQPGSAQATWPIHGVITTLFGVPHWPYQPIHTGLDISDGQRPGVTPVKAFKPGTVVQVIHSSSGFGNHVIVDHGGGMTSLYGHLASTAVQVGQVVDNTTTLGFEGSTGASTGTHLHFEIQINGQPVDPLHYVNGRP